MQDATYRRPRAHLNDRLSEVVAQTDPADWLVRVPMRACDGLPDKLSKIVRGCYRGFRPYTQMRKKQCRPFWPLSVVLKPTSINRRFATRPRGRALLVIAC